MADCSPINPKVITWARSRSGLTIEALAARMKKDVKEVIKWEDGSKTPSYTSLEELAYTHFKIPLAVFFFADPPKIEEPFAKFRRLPEFERNRFSSDTLYKLRLAKGYQESLKELSVGMEKGRAIFRDIGPKGQTPVQLANAIREYLGVTISKQFSFQSVDGAFKFWRHAITEAGIYIFKDSLKDRYISGFCLLDANWPIIFINNANSFTRQIFSLIHELAHIIYDIHGVTDIDESYLAYMDENDRSLEIKCNKVAGLVLVPDEIFEAEIPMILEEGLASIPRYARKYSVSREVILRKLLDYGAIDHQEYETLAQEWTKDFLRKKPSRPGGNPYLTKLAYLGEDFTRLAFANYSAGRIDNVDLAYHLNVKSRFLEKLEKYVRW